MEIKLLGGFDGHERKGGGIQTGYQVFDPEGICPCLLADMGGYGIMVAEIKIIGKMDHTLDNTHESANRIYSQYGLCPTIPTCAGGNIQPKILEGEENMIDKQIVTMRGRGEHNEQRLEPNRNGTTNALTTVQKDNLVLVKPRYRIRKLTPRECWRLMGFSDTDFDKAEKVCSNTQLYKQAGNSIVVNVLMGIFNQML